MVYVTTIEPKSGRKASGIVCHDGEYSYEEIYVQAITEKKELRQVSGRVYHVLDKNGESHVIIYLMNAHIRKTLLTSNKVARGFVCGDYMVRNGSRIEITLDCVVKSISVHLISTDKTNYKVYSIIEVRGSEIIAIEIL